MGFEKDKNPPGFLALRVPLDCVQGFLSEQAWFVPSILRGLADFSLEPIMGRLTLA